MKLKPFLVCKIVLIFVMVTGIFFATIGRNFLMGKESFQSDIENQGGFQSGYQRALPGQSCGSKCRYFCNNLEVEQEETAVCKPATGTIACDELSPAKCTVSCQDPVCFTDCFKSESKCSLGNCPKCVTRCNPPECVVNCSSPKPNCRSVPNKSDCKFVYKTPSKPPKPNCVLKCDKDENLLNKVGF